MRVQSIEILIFFAEWIGLVGLLRSDHILIIYSLRKGVAGLNDLSGDDVPSRKSTAGHSLEMQGSSVVAWLANLFNNEVL